MDPKKEEFLSELEIQKVSRSSGESVLPTCSHLFEAL